MGRENIPGAWLARRTAFSKQKSSFTFSSGKHFITVCWHTQKREKKKNLRSIPIYSNHLLPFSTNGPNVSQIFKEELVDFRKEKNGQTSRDKNGESKRLTARQSWAVSAAPFSSRRWQHWLDLVASADSLAAAAEVWSRWKSPTRVHSRRPRNQNLRHYDGRNPRFSLLCNQY